MVADPASPNNGYAVASSATMAPRFGLPRRLEDLLGWRLLGPRVSDPGRIRVNEAGTTISDYTIEARAVPVVAGGRGEGEADPRYENLLVSGRAVDARATAGEAADGRFRARLTIFSPAKSGNGWMAGQWYIEGTWTLETALVAKLAGVDRPCAMRGTLRSQLPFNPVVEAAEFAAEVEVTEGPAAGWATGKDAMLRFDEHLRGSLAMRMGRVQIARAEARQ